MLCIVEQVLAAPSRFQMLDEKADDHLARFSCILGTRDHTDPSATPTRKLVFELPGLLPIEAVRCAFDVSHYRVLTCCWRPHRDKGVAWAFAFLIIYNGPRNLDRVICYTWE